MSLIIESFPALWIAKLCAAAAVIGCLYLVVAAVLVLRFPRPAPPLVRHLPVTILKPLCGDEPGLFRRLAGFCDQDYSAPVEIVLGAQDHADPALDAANRLKTTRSDRSVVLAVDRRSHGSNRKVSNLTNMAALARHEVVVMTDSDIEVAPDYLARVVAELQRPGAGAVTCLYHGKAHGGIWARLAALAINTHFVPGVVTAATFNLARPCFGATIALRRSTLERIGGLRAFADCLADDHAIGEAVRAAGLKVVIPGFSVAHVCFQPRLRELWAHQVRFVRTIRSIDPLGHAGVAITHPLPLALVAHVFGSGYGLWLAALAIACRMLLCLSVERAFAVERQPYWLIPIQDLFTFAVYASSFFGATVSWRGSRYRVLSDGTVVHDQ